MTQHSCARSPNRFSCFRSLLTGIFGFLLASAVIVGCSDTDIRHFSQPALPAAPAGMPSVFWDTMTNHGAIAGLHDGYQACVEPELGVVPFDVEVHGSLVNPAFDAGYVLGVQAVARQCPQLIAFHTQHDRAARADQRLAVVGVALPTADAHPDYGKGFDAGRETIANVDCDQTALHVEAAPPSNWTIDFESEFLSGYVAALELAASSCPIY